MTIWVEVDEHNDVIRVETENQCLELRELTAIERSLKDNAIQRTVKR